MKRERRKVRVLAAPLLTTTYVTSAKKTASPLWDSLDAVDTADQHISTPIYCQQGLREANDYYSDTYLISVK